MSNTEILVWVGVLFAALIYRIREVYKQNPVMFEPIFALTKKETWRSDKK